MQLSARNKRTRVWQVQNGAASRGALQLNIHTDTSTGKYLNIQLS